MKKSIRFLSYFSLGVLAFLLISCGSAPSIKESKVLNTNVEKTHSFQFIYRNAEMKTTSSYSYGRGASPDDTGFRGFGTLLAKQAEAAFAQRGVAAIDAKVLDGQTPISVDSAPKGAGGVILPMLIIAPISGKTSSNGRSTSTSYVFSVLLIDPNTHSTIWRATIDTSTWSGQDIVLKHVEKTLYDASYASQLLKAVADQMKQDGVI